MGITDKICEITGYCCTSIAPSGSQTKGSDARTKTFTVPVGQAVDMLREYKASPSNSDRLTAATLQEPKDQGIFKKDALVVLDGKTSTDNPSKEYIAIKDNEVTQDVLVETSSRDYTKKGDPPTDWGNPVTNAINNYNFSNYTQEEVRITDKIARNNASTLMPNTFVKTTTDYKANPAVVSNGKIIIQARPARTETTYSACLTQHECHDITKEQFDNKFNSIPKSIVGDIK